MVYALYKVNLPRCWW